MGLHFLVYMDGGEDSAGQLDGCLVMPLDEGQAWTWT